MSDKDKIRQEIERRAKFHDDAMKACTGLNNIALTHSAGWKEDTELLTFIDSLPEESQMPMPEDTVIFQRGVAEGRRLEREDRNDDKLQQNYCD